MSFENLIAMRIVYLCGPIADYDEEYCANRFYHAELICREKGAIAVYNPMSRTVRQRFSGLEYSQQLMANIHVLTASNVPGKPLYEVLVQLPGWSSSPNAVLETEIAKACGIEVVRLPVGEW